MNDNPFTHRMIRPPHSKVRIVRHQHNPGEFNRVTVEYENGYRRIWSMSHFLKYYSRIDKESPSQLTKTLNTKTP
jgi:hypothetical protein